MGSACSSIKEVTTDNICNNHIGQSSDDVIEGFCSYAGPAGDSFREEWCDKVAGDEWDFDERGDTCTYDDCNPYRQEDTGCCQGCCGIVGQGVRCKRKKFNGDGLNCCFNDLEVCPQTQNACWSDGPAKQKTCDPCQRNITSNNQTMVSDPSGDSMITCQQNQQIYNYPEPYTCRDLVFNHCTGADLAPGDSEWINRWINQETGQPLGRNQNGCLFAIQRNLFGKGGCNITPTLSGACIPQNLGQVDTAGFQWSRDVIDTVLERYSQSGFVIGSLPGTPGYNQFQEFLYNYVACPYPVLLQDGLNSICRRYTSQEMEFNPSIANWCGCYLNNKEYSKYVDQYQVNKQCTPLCNRTAAIPLVTGGNQALLCDQDSCIIDDLAINLAGTTVTGKVEINQMCGNCSSGEGASCACRIENNTINGLNSIIGNINIGETCTSAVCTQTNQDGNLVTVPCDGSSSQSESGDTEEEFSSVVRIVISIVILIVIIGILFFILFLINLGTKKKPQKEDDRR